MPDQFAIITFRSTGPIKTWSDMRAANVHNARTKPLAHAMPGAEPPDHLIGSSDLVADVKQHLRAAGIDPDRLRKNGVIAYEAILSASAEFFDAGTAEGRAARLTAWKAAQRDWALKRYGAHRIASMVLHVDEKVPHIHLIVIPFEVKTDGRRKDAEPRWALVGRTISGPGRFDEVQDAYAAAMTSFGLARGVRGSGRKHEPVPVYLARMAAKEHAIDAATVSVEQERRGLAADRADLDHRARQMADRIEEMERDNVAHRLRLEQERTAMLRVSDAETQWLRRWDAELVAAEQALATGEEDLASRQSSFARFRDDLVITREKLVPIVAAAKEFVRIANGMRPEDVVPAARPAVAAARRVMEACRSPTPPAHVIGAAGYHVSPSAMSR